MLKVLSTGDWHFRDKDHDEILRCCEFIVESARKDKPDVIVHSGDVTHSEFLKLDSRSARSIFRLFVKLRNIAPVAVIIGTKSHDGTVSKALESTGGKYPIIVSEYTEQIGYYEWLDKKIFGPINSEEFYDITPEFIISQIPQPTKKYFVNNLTIEDSDEAIQNAMELMFVGFNHEADKFNCPHVVNMHIQVGGCYISEHQQLIGRDIEVSKKQLNLLNADVICLGHIHKQQQISENAFYPGSPTRMNHGETEIKGFYYQMISDDKLKSEFIETPARQMFSIKEDFTKENNPIAELYMVLYTYSSVELENAHIKVVLTVWQDEAKHINESDIKKFYLDAGALECKVSIMRKPRETVRSSKVCDAISLPDKLGAMAELRCEEISNDIIDKANSLELNQMDYEEKYQEIIK